MVTSKQRRSAAALTTAATVAAVLAGCGVLSQDPDRETVVIGVDLEQTGGGSALGTVYQEALELRVAQINEQGLLGDRELELRFSDNRSDSATSRSNITEFTADPDVSAIIMGGCDECAIAATDAIQEGATPTIVLAAASEITEPVSERAYVFQIGPRAGDSARLLADEMIGDDTETIALVTTDDVYGQEGRAQMAAAAERLGVAVVVDQTITADEDRISAVATAIVGYGPEPELDPVTLQPLAPEQEGPDAVVIWASGEEAGQLAQELRDQDYEGRFYLDASAADQLFLSGPAAALDDAKMAFVETLVIDGVIATSPAKAARQTWFNQYTSQVGTYHAYSSFAADGLQVILEAINRSGSAGRSDIRTELENLQIDGFSGPIRFRLETHSGLNPLGLVTLVAQGDRWRVAAG